MGEISKYTFKRLFLFYLISKFPDGCMGSTRLQKISFLASDKAPLKPFTFASYIYGQFSDDLNDILAQLIRMRYVCPIPLGERGNNYIAEQKHLNQYYSEVLSKISPETKDAIDKTVEEYGFKSWDELKHFAYEYSSLPKKALLTPILEENLDDKIIIKDLSDDICEELELSLNPTFIACTSKIIEAIDSGKIK